MDAGKGLAIGSLVCGIISFICLPFILAPVAIVLGIIAYTKGTKGMAIAGIICGALSLVLCIASIVIIPLLMPLFAGLASM